MLQTLANVISGNRAKIVSVNSGCRFQTRLAEMGLFRGMDVEILSNVPGRPMVVRANDCRLVICRNMADKILATVQETREDSDPSRILPPGTETRPMECKQVCLRQMAVNQSGVIRAVKAEGELGRRIRDMGLVPNTEITIVGRAPLKDPVALRLRDFTLSLRNNEADHILVDVGA